MDNISRKYANKLYELSISNFPQRVVSKATQCFVDYLSVVIGGAGVYSNIHNEYIEKNKCFGECHVFGLSLKTDLKTAVMMNAFDAHILELDDSHREAMTHLGAPIFSALLGVAEIYNNTIGELLHASVVGYEAAIRLANAIQPSHKRRGFHVSGTCCTVGCAIAVASMLKYSKVEMENVLSAASTSAAGLLAVISGKSEQKPYNIANAAVTGVDAALYGHFFTGALDILGDSRGFFHAFSDEVDTDRLFEDGYAIEGIYQKLYASCRHCHAPLEAMLLLKSKTKFDVHSIKSIVVKTYDLAIKGHDHTEITGVSSAKQSIPYSVVAALLFNECGQMSFTQESIDEVKQSNLLGKVMVIEEPELTALVPDKRAAIIEITLNNNEELISQKVDYAKGEPENPISADEWTRKLLALADYGGVSESKVFKLVSSVEKEKSSLVNIIFQTLS